MSILATEKWSDKRLSLAAPWKATRVFDVTGTPDEATALSAVGIKLNDGHPYNPKRLKTNGPYVRSRTGPFSFEIGADYGVPDFGLYPDQTSDPLTMPVRIKWDDCEICEAVDLDLSNRPMLYSNGEPVSPNGSRPIVYKTLRLVKNFPFWDTSINQAYENSVNSDPIVLIGGPTIASEHMRCKTIIPLGEFTTTEFMPLVFFFEIFFDNSLGPYPFQHRFLDQGTYGFASGANSPSKFVNSQNNNEVIGSPIRLDGTGKPLAITSNSDVKVLKVGSAVAPVANPKPVTFYHTTPLADSQIIYYERVRKVTMLPLLDSFNS